MTFWLGVIVGAFLGASLAILGLGLCAAARERTARTTGKRVGVWLVDGATPFFPKLTDDLPRCVTWEFDEAAHITGLELQRDGFVVKGILLTHGPAYVLPGESFTLSWNAEEEDRAFALVADDLRSG